MHSGTIRSAVRIFILAAVSVLFMLVYSVSTSPMTVNYGHDSAFFVLVGQGMKEGLLPYRDFFDMKGPYFFFLEYLGQLICNGRTGAFILQCINMFACLYIIDRIYHRNQTEQRTGAWLKDCLRYVLPCLYVFAYTMERGNLTEEFSLPLLLLSLYFVLAYQEKTKADRGAGHPLKYGVFYGVAFGILALSRITNAAFIGAILVTISVDLILRRKFGNFFLNGLVFIFGCVVAFAPMCLYYGQQGLLGEMISQVFLFGVQYSSEESMGAKIVNFVVLQYPALITMMLPMVVAALFKVKDWKYWCLSVFSYLLLIFACVLGHGYAHYLTLGIPHLVLGFALLKNLCEARPVSRGNVVVLVLLFLVMGQNVLSTTVSCCTEILDRQQSMNERLQILEIRDAIPEHERDSTYLMDVVSCSNWYLQAEMFPCNRYCDWQESYMILKPEIKEEILLFLIEDSPKWFVSSTRTGIVDPKIAQIVASRYNVYATNETYILYVLAE